MNELPFILTHKKSTDPDLLILQECLTVPSQKRLDRYFLCSTEERENRVPFFKDQLEITKVHSTRFLTKGYSHAIENALEHLRMSIIKIFMLQVKAVDKHEVVDETIIIKFNTLLFVYNALCDISCLQENKEGDFIKGVETKDPVLLLTCLTWDKIIEKKLEDSSFLPANKKLTPTKVRNWIQLWKLKGMIISLPLAKKLFAAAKGKHIPLYCLGLIELELERLCLITFP